MQDGTIYPSLFYRDAPAAIDWLGKAFGYEVLMIVPGETEDVVIHSELRFGDGIIMVGTSGGRNPWAASPLDLPGLNQGLYIYVEDVDALFERATAAGAEVLEKPHDEDYGRTCGLGDPEGHRWWFGNYRPGC
jgi:uncharacterized glyoxalase superfamily protein PhnB